MTRLKALLKKADKAAVIGMTAAVVAMATLGAGGVKTYASDYSVQKYVDIIIRSKIIAVLILLAIVVRSLCIEM